MRERYVLCWDTNTQSMGVTSASAIHIINVSLFDGDVSLKTFLEETSVVQDVSATLSRTVWRGAVCVKETMKYADSDIKLARAKNDLDVFQLLSLPLLVFIEETK